METGQAFVILQIGDAQLDLVYERAIAPALRACGLAPKRVDRHNAGGLLHSEIIAFIEESDLIVADLTNERPNCYLEVGYALGSGRFTSLILTVREDHCSDSPNHRPDGPKVHFDLIGYDILPWAPERLPRFREELEKRAQRRLRMLHAGT
jgi:nucleoside 2-deoxyribosyltransferase